MWPTRKRNGATTIRLIIKKRKVTKNCGKTTKKGNENGKPERTAGHKDKKKQNRTEQNRKKQRKR